MDRKTLDELFASLSSALALYAKQWCRTPEDAVQEAFIDLLNCPFTPTSPKAWLYTTTRRKSQNIARSESRQRSHIERFGESEDGKSGHDYWVECSTRNGIAASDVVDGLEQLEPDQREVIVAKIWGELNFDELGELMDCSPSTAYRLYKQALAALKRCMLAVDQPEKDLPSAGRRS